MPFRIDASQPDSALTERPPLSATVVFRAPEKHLIAVLIRDPQGIGLLRHIQCVEQRAGPDFGIVQIGGVMFHPIQGRMRTVCAAKSKELDDEHCSNSVSLCGLVDF
jgi:hypothetical protein